MNQTVRLLLLSLTLFASALLAQQSSSSGSEELHFGEKNVYKIGTSDDPVTVPEYCDFLNAKAPTDCAFVESDYYDKSFMKVSTCCGYYGSSKGCILRIGWSLGYSPKGYHYSVISGHENDIIDAVYYQHVQNEFYEWRMQKEFNEWLSSKK